MKNQFENIEINDRFIKELYFKDKEHPNINYLRKDWLDAHPNIKDYLERRYIDSGSIKETVYRIFLNIEERPVCPVCGGRLKFESTHRFSRKERNGRPFLVCCSPKCAANYEKTKLHKKQGSIRHYGTDNPAKAKEVQDKMKETNRKKYGVDNPYQSEEIKNKIRETNIQKYGVDNAMKLKVTVEKCKQTNRKKYNADCYAQTDAFKKFMQDNKETFTEKIFDTKRKNHSFKKSSKEDKLFEILSSNWKVIRQYHSEVYPYACDFFIPELNLYIEYNGTWTHGKHPYNKNNSTDTDILLEWQNKGVNSNFYSNAIETWTIRDVNKLNTAKQNKLNYLMIYQNISFQDIVELIVQEYTNTTVNKQLIVGIS